MITNIGVSVDQLCVFTDIPLSLSLLPVFLSLPPQKLNELSAQCRPPNAQSTKSVRAASDRLDDGEL